MREEITESDLEGESDSDDAQKVQKWAKELRQAGKRQKKWLDRCDKIHKEFRAERDGENEADRFNLYWASVEITKPYLYSSTPKVMIARRFGEKDDIARLSAELWERATENSLDDQSFDYAAESSALDYILYGRGVLWNRLEVELEDAQEDSQELIAMEGGGYATLDGQRFDGDLSLVKVTDEGNAVYTPAPYKRIKSQRVVTDFIDRRNFRHSGGALWGDVTWAARRVLMTKEEGRKRFGDKFKFVPLTHGSDTEGTEEKPANEKSHTLAEVWEIWDDSKKKVYWICDKYEKAPLDEKDFFLSLQSRFPCARPAFGTLTSDTLTPVPDYVQAQDTLADINNLTERKSLLVEALSIRGFYDSSKEELKNLLSTDATNMLIPIDNWAMHAEKGGIRGVVDFFPLEMVTTTLSTIIELLARAKQDYYELTGISDIVRGVTDPRETASAQNTKAGYANRRFEEKKRQFQRFIKDTVAIRAEIMAEHFTPEQLLKMSGHDFVDPKYKEAIPQMIALLKDADGGRDYRIDIETNSTIAADANQSKVEATEFLAGVMNFLDRAGVVVQYAPEFTAAMGAMLLMSVRNMPQGRMVESELESAIEQIKQRLAQQPQQQPGQPQGQGQPGQQNGGQPEIDPVAMQRVQIDKQKAELAAFVEQKKIEIMRFKAEADAQVKSAKVAGELENAKRKIEGDMLIKGQSALAKNQIEQAKLFSTDY